MPGLDRLVAGITCREVLKNLSDFLDGDLPAPRGARIRAHLADCRGCERFDGSMGALLTAMRHQLAEPAAVDRAIEQCLRGRFRAART